MKLSSKRRFAMVATLSIALAGVGLASVAAGATSPNPDPAPTTSVLGPEGEQAAAEEVERRGMEAAPIGDASDAVGEYLETSGWAQFSRVEIKDLERIVIKGIGPIPDEVMDGASAAAAGFPVSYVEVTFTETDYREKATILFERLGDEGAQVATLDMTDNSTVEVELVQSDRTEYIESVVRSVFEGFPLKVKLAPADYTGMPVFASR